MDYISSGVTTDAEAIALVFILLLCVMPEGLRKSSKKKISAKKVKSLVHVYDMIISKVFM